MWFPHFGFIFTPRHTVDKQKIEASRKDREMREFEVQFDLENLDSRIIRDVPIRLSKIEIKKQSDQRGNECFLKFDPNEENRLMRVTAKFDSDRMIEAVKFSYNSICHLLSFWSLMYGVCIGVYGILVYDKKHDAIFEASPQRTEADPLVFPEVLGFDEKFKVIVALYREGRNSVSPFYRFLCFFKILEAFYEKREAFREMDELIRQSQGALRRVKRRITGEMIALSLVIKDQRQLFENISFGKAFKNLNAQYRVGIAHTYPTDTQWANLDDFDTYMQYVWLSNLADLMTRQIILDELELWREAHEKGLAKP